MSMQHVTLAGPCEDELAAALSAHYEQWKRDTWPGGPPARLAGEDLQEAFLGGYHMALSVLLHLPGRPAA